MDVDSTLEGVLPNFTGEILFYNSWGSYFCVLDPRGEFVYDTGFTWDLVEDLYSQRSIHDDFWST